MFTNMVISPKIGENIKIRKTNAFLGYIDVNIFEKSISLIQFSLDHTLKREKNTNGERPTTQLAMVCIQKHSTMH